MKASTLFLAVTIMAVPSVAQTPDALGAVSFPISCSAAAQADFNHATALLHHMTYPQARSAYQAIADREPACAMAHWGVAMTLFQPLWPTRPTLAERQRGWQEAERAVALAPATERERVFAAAAAAFFADPAGDDYWARIRRWEAAMERVHAAAPDDAEASAFLALALLATAPQDRVDRGNADRAAVLLLDVYHRNPAHPGAMHYLVHANDMPGREGESLEIVARYDSLAPQNPHALHMPTHIFTRLGDWPAVIHGNRLAADAALRFPAGDSGQYVWDEFPHAIEYLIYAELQRGDDTAAAAALHWLQGTERLQPSFKTAFHLASAAARYPLERRAWAEAVVVARIDVPGLDWSRFAWPEAIIAFANGLGAAHLGDMASASAAVARLDTLESRAAGEAIFARNIRILRLELRSWIAHASARPDTAIALMREAEALEAATPKHAVTPGPTLPATELLGDLLLAEGHADRALQAYQRSLAAYPRRFNSLLGAMQAAEQGGDPSAAAGYRSQLRSLMVTDSPRSAVVSGRR